MRDRIGAEYRINRYLNNEDVNKISENVAGQLAEAGILHYGKDTELRADQYAYRLLINLIMQQKKNEVPEELQVFWEDQYLSPIILFEMFRLFDVYSELKGKKIVYQDHPTPKERQDNIFSMFKDDIPEEMNTEEGNKVLNLMIV